MGLHWGRPTGDWWATRSARATPRRTRHCPRPTSIRVGSSCTSAPPSPRTFPRRTRNRTPAGLRHWSPSRPHSACNACCRCSPCTSRMDRSCTPSHFARRQIYPRRTGNIRRRLQFRCKTRAGSRCSRATVLSYSRQQPHTCRHNKDQRLALLQRTWCCPRPTSIRAGMICKCFGPKNLGIFPCSTVCTRFGHPKLGSYPGCNFCTWFGPYNAGTAPHGKRSKCLTTWICTSPQDRLDHLETR